MRAVKPTVLARATRTLSDHYRDPDDNASRVLSDTDVLAYLAYRFPATFAAVRAALAEVHARMPGWSPRSLLDLGAGPGTAVWAAMETWPSIEQVELVERDHRMIALGQRLMRDAANSVFTEARWTNADLGDHAGIEPQDLVLSSYAWGELSTARQGQLLEHLWSETTGVLVLIEPGTPAGFQVIRAARARLLELGAHVIAPCPHDGPCPMPHDDWCHFSQRLVRSQEHRAAKEVSIGYEDEKFSYVAVSRLMFEPVHNRLLRHPQVRSGHIHLELCTRHGLQHQIVSKKRRRQFREARHAHWGDAIDEDVGTDDGHAFNSSDEKWP